MTKSANERQPPSVSGSLTGSTFALPRGFGIALGASLAWAPSIAAGAPAGISWALATTLLGASLAALVARPRNEPPRWLLGALGLTLLAWPDGTTRAGGWLCQVAGFSAIDGLRLLLASRLIGVAAFLAALGAPLRPGRTHTLWVAGGFLSGWLLPAWLVLPASLPAILLLDRLRLPIPVAERPPPAGPWTVVSAAGAAWACASLWLYLRGGYDPTPTGGIFVTSGGASGFLVGRWLAARRPGSPWLSAVLGALAALSVGLLLSLGAPRLQPLLPALLAARPPWVVLDLLLTAASAAVAFLFGLATPGARRRWGPTAPLLAAVGVAIPVAIQLGPRGPLLLALTGFGIGIGVLLFGSPRSSRLGGLLMALLVAPIAGLQPAIQERWFVSGWPTAVTGAPDLDAWITARDEAIWTRGRFGPGGTWALRTVAEARVAEIDGAPLRATGRAAEATAAAARLLTLTAPRTGRLLVLGDDLGIATATLAERGASRVLSAIAHPELLQVWAAEDTSLRTRLLAPSVQLVGTTGAWALASGGRQDGILSLTLHPWTDSSGRVPGGPFFSGVRRSLAEDGVFVGLVEVSGLAPTELRALVGSFTEAFPQGAACLPPSGADHLLLLGPRGTGLPLFERIETRLRATGLEGADGEGPLEVADRCVLPASRLAEWAQQGPARRRWPLDRLPSRRLGAAPTNLGVFAGAVGNPDEVWDLGSSEELATVLGRRFEASGHFLALLTRAHEGNPAGLLAEAEAMRAVSDDTRALETLIAPHVARAAHLMDEARGDGPTSKLWQSAIDELVLARLIHPKSPAPVKLLGLAYEARGELRKAEHQYEQALSLSPADTDLLYGLARAASGRGDTTDAEAALRRATELAPQEWTTHQNLGVLLLKLGRSGEAEDTLRRAADLAPQDEAAPQAALAEVFLQQGRPAVALAQAELTLRIETSAYHWFLDGRCLLEVGDERRAEAAFYQSVYLDPGFFLARGALGQIYAQRGDYQQAVEAFEAVLEQEPGNEAARVNLQQAQALLNTQEQASAPGADPSP